MQCRFTDLKYKEVINIRTGVRLGFVADILFETQSGKIAALIVPGPYKYLGLFGRAEDCVIPWEYISRIGSDIILVEAPENHRHDRKKRRSWQTY